MGKVKVNVVGLQPSQGKHWNLVQQYLWRTKGIFEGDNEIYICDTLEPIWWNRPLVSEYFVKLEDDGLWSYNLPLLENIPRYKTNYNSLLARNTIAYSAHIKLDETWTEEEIKRLYTLSFDVLYDSLLELGVDKDKLQVTGNDFNYNGKKFAGIERMLKDNVFTENFVITLKVLPEKDIFDRLTGKYVKNKPLTGIEEEVHNVTKYKVIEKMYEKITAFLKEIDK